MKILMFTNTYLPHVGGVARSVSTFDQALCRRGHEVRVVAPQFDGADDPAGKVLRTPAIQNFNGSDFSFRIPQPGLIADFVDDFRPDVLHSHHPFLLGDAALRVAWARRLPLVFTYHTMYEQYTHYVPLTSDAIKRFAIQMATDYCNLCAHVIAPSESVARLIAERGVITPVTSIPTGIDVQSFASGNRKKARMRFHIPDDVIVIGHVGRLAAEKNLEYLAGAVGRHLRTDSSAVFLLVGTGELAEPIKSMLAQAYGSGRMIMPGCLTGQDLVDAYAAIDIFAFSSKSETQGMVLAEAMAAGAAAVALDAPGAREIVTQDNGRLLSAGATAEEFAAALAELATNRTLLESCRQAARRSAEAFSVEHCTDQLVAVYEKLVQYHTHGRDGDPGPWDRLLGRLDIEWNLLREKTAAIVAAAREASDDTPTLH